MNIYIRRSILLFSSLIVLTGCFSESEVGTTEWCASLAEKPKGEWTLNESKSYAKHCLFR